MGLLLFSKEATPSRQCNLGYATRWSTDPSREAFVDNEWLCNISYAIYAVRSRLCNLGYATRLLTGASREAPVDNEWLGYAALCPAMRCLVKSNAWWWNHMSPHWKLKKQNSMHRKSENTLSTNRLRFSEQHASKKCKIRTTCIEKVKTLYRNKMWPMSKIRTACSEKVKIRTACIEKVKTLYRQKIQIQLLMRPG